MPTVLQRVVVVVSVVVPVFKSWLSWCCQILTPRARRLKYAKNQGGVYSVVWQYGSLGLGLLGRYAASQPQSFSFPFRYALTQGGKSLAGPGFVINASHKRLCGEKQKAIPPWLVLAQLHTLPSLALCPFLSIPS
jgi:hypothetical protein